MTRGDLLEQLGDQLALIADRLRDLNRTVSSAEKARLMNLARTATQEAQSWIIRALEQK